MKTIAIIGTGIMGGGMAANFLKHGYPVVVWNRTKRHAKKYASFGAQIVDTPKEAAAKADIVFEVTANDQSSKKAWLGPKGILAGTRSGSIAIACATLSAEWVDQLAKLAADKRVTFFDIPLTGGRIGAETGKLVLLVGGDQKKLKTIEKDLGAISETIYYFGKAGSGARFKLLLNTLQAIHVQALGEMLAIAKAVGLDQKAVGDVLAERPGGTTTKLAWRDFQKEPKPINFSVKWITKDVGYAKKLAKKVKTPFLDDALKKYKKAMKQGMADRDWTTVNKL